MRSPRSSARRARRCWPAAIWVSLSALGASSAADIRCPGEDPETEPECVVRWAKSTGDYASAVGWLERRLAALTAPDEGDVSLALAELALAEGLHQRLIERSSAAVESCFFSPQSDCELRARRLLAYALSQTDRLDEAIWEAEKAYFLAVKAGTPQQQYKTAVTLARLRLSGLVDLGRVERLLNQIEPLSDIAEPSDLLYAESTRAGVLNLLGYLDQAALSYARVRELALAQGNEVIGASEEFNRIDSLVESNAVFSSNTQRAAAAAALEALIQSSKTPVATRLRALALLAWIDPGQAQVRLRECLEIATRIDDARSIARCAAELAISTLDGTAAGAEAAAGLIATARQAASRSSNPNADLEVARAEMTLLWETLPSPAALDRSLSLLAAEARRRNRQASPARQREFLAFLNEDHYWLADRIAAGVADGALPSGRVEQALALLESVRGKAEPRSDPAVAVERRLADWWSTAEALRRADPSKADSAAPSRFREFEAMPDAFLTSVEPPWAGAAELDLSAVRRALEPGQAIVYFQWLQPSGTGSAWVYLVSADTALTRRLPAPGSVELALALLNSSVRRGHTDEFDSALDRLLERLLAPVLAHLPGIERLVLVPDAALYSVPLQALGRRAAGLKQIEIYPSIGAWMDRVGAAGGSASVWVFANPRLPPAKPAVTGFGPKLERLPGAEREAAALAALLGARAHVALESDATESRALEALESPAGVVHFATHAVLNATNPQASAVVLAPDHVHDGWLTLAQISALDIPPKLIVLSACEAASGRMLTGEGLIGLASGFLGAGARAVLANLWPVDDAHAAVFIQRVYALLDRGETLEHAIARAADDLARAGYPSTAWAGWTLIGDGTSVLSTPPRHWGWALALGVGLLLAAAWGAHRRP